MLGPIISENDPPFFSPWVTSANQSWKNLKPCLGFFCFVLSHMSINFNDILTPQIIIIILLQTLDFLKAFLFACGLFKFSPKQIMYMRTLNRETTWNNIAYIVKAQLSLKNLMYWSEFSMSAFIVNSVIRKTRQIRIWPVHIEIQAGQRLAPVMWIELFLLIRSLIPLSSQTFINVTWP